MHDIALLQNYIVSLKYNNYVYVYYMYMYVVGTQQICKMESVKQKHIYLTTRYTPTRLFILINRQL